MKFLGKRLRCGSGNIKAKL
uniref:Uncharacterized protein n=1 Tax=Rhizophora mucronata TaxID=61149 RepID=A0A2P2Q2B6_RHIMU